MLEERIRNMITYVAGHPGEDTAMIADRFLSGNVETSHTRDIVVPELLKLSPSKRTLLVNIVRSKTNCNLYSDNDYKHNYVMLKELGEVIREVPKFAKKIKWFLQ